MPVVLRLASRAKGLHRTTNFWWTANRLSGLRLDGSGVDYEPGRNVYRESLSVVCGPRPGEGKKATRAAKKSA
jgi:hypothetical protein